MLRYHRKTHPTYSALQLTGVQKNVFIYGRGVRERSEFYRLKAGYFTLKFHPHIGPRSENRTQLVRLRAGYFATKV